MSFFGVFAGRVFETPAVIDTWSKEILGTPVENQWVSELMRMEVELSWQMREDRCWRDVPWCDLIHFNPSLSMKAIVLAAKFFLLISQFRQHFAYISFARSFFVLTFLVCTFLPQEYWCKGCSCNVGEIDTRGQFHQSSTRSFYVCKLGAQLFCAYILALYSTGVRLLA